MADDDSSIEMVMDVPYTSVRVPNHTMAFHSASCSAYGSSVYSSAVPSRFVAVPSTAMKEKLRQEILDDLKAEGLLKSKSELKELTAERMSRKIDSIIKVVESEKK